jgi:hypothetical protein
MLTDFYFRYWRYYNDDYSWDDSGELFRPDFVLSSKKLQETGLSADEAKSYVESGFIYVEVSNTIIDRYYGGAITSIDWRTRFRLRDFSLTDPKIKQKSHVVVRRAKSWHDVREIVETFAAKSPHRRLLFRGQTQGYTVSRKVHNPHFVVDGIGEISLIPSVWRRMLSRRPDSYVSFYNLSLEEWSAILLSAFDVKDIEKRRQALLNQGEQIFTKRDMADCSDPILSEFSHFQMDVAAGLQFYLADLLATLLQHYGLDSCVLDLTTSLEVAMFFATHRFVQKPSGCAYKHVGTNDRRSVLYVLREDVREMQSYESDDRVIKKLFPLRPMRQACVISKSGPYALNLPADFLIGVIQLDFESITNESNLSVDYLFPGLAEDAFARALTVSPFVKRHMTSFGLAPHRRNRRRRSK